MGYKLTISSKNESAESTYTTSPQDVLWNLFRGLQLAEEIEFQIIEFTSSEGACLQDTSLLSVPTEYESVRNACNALTERKNEVFAKKTKLVARKGN
jgi:hypothetical protein